MHYILKVIFVLIVFWLGGYIHESDLLRHCAEEQTMHFWNSDIQIICKIVE